MEARSATAVRSIDDRKPSRGGTLDGRTVVARRRRELFDIYAAALGGPADLSEGQRLDIRKAAELTALAEQARARAMREGITDAGELSAMIRLEGMAARAVRALNLPVGGPPPVMSLHDHVARRAAERAAKSDEAD